MPAQCTIDPSVTQPLGRRLSFVVPPTQCVALCASSVCFDCVGLGVWLREYAPRESVSKSLRGVTSGVPLPKGDVHKRKEVVQDVTLHDLDLANAKPQGGQVR